MKKSISASGSLPFRTAVFTPIVLAFALTVQAAPQKPSRFWKKMEQKNSTGLNPRKAAKSGSRTPGRSLTVRTTAYTHNEKDHHKYGRSNAIGSRLKYGETRSAAADWSIFPLGTKFRIEGDPNTYVIDDYGSALVGKETIDLYKPSRNLMNAWGVRHVKIQIIEKGSLERSLKFLKERTRYAHVRKMVAGLREKLEG
jgi:3D (Asp-Asp-Asp) domain-containing protein